MRVFHLPGCDVQPYSNPSAAFAVTVTLVGASSGVYVVMEAVTVYHAKMLSLQQLRDDFEVTLKLTLK